VHFTYAATLDRTSLFQGDVLRRTPEVDAVLREVHPHYTKDDYRYLMVLTQSCDLVRRYAKNTQCKARYLSLAAVRPFSLVLSREIERFQRNPLERAHQLCDATHREKVHQFAERLMNNNEEEYFYLHPFQHRDVPAGVAEPVCAFLALSIAVKSELHYETCLAAKILQLDESFQHKLGWLTGKMYSRVGTADWVPDALSEEEFETYVASVVGDACAWIDPTVRNKLFKRLKDVAENERTPQRVLAEYEELKASTPKKKEMFVERLGEILTEQGLDEQVTKRIKNLVMSDPDIATLVAK
jgi:hypothetical protein